MSTAKKLVIKETKELRPYQLRIMHNLFEALFIQGKKTLLGMATGAGKTFVAHSLVSHRREIDPNFRVLVLAHNQIVLRENFMSECLVPTVEVVSGATTKTKEYKEACMVVAIPATIHKLTKRELGRFDLIIVDEAHEYYHKGMVQKILKLYPKAKQLALTATHGKFDPKIWHKELFSVMEAFDVGVLSNANIEIVKAKWNYTDKDFNTDDELKSGYRTSKKEIKDICDTLYARLKSVKGTDSAKYNSKTKLKLERFSCPKTMVASYNIEMADAIYDYFKPILGDEVVISYSEGESGRHDAPAENLARFKEDSSCRMLIVVRRGILGFDCPELEYMVDLTATKNVERALQLCGRILRKPVLPVAKIYLKIVPESLVYMTEAMMAAVIALWHKDNDLRWSGAARQAPIIKRTKEGGTEVVVRGLGAKGPGIKGPGTKPPVIHIPDFVLNFEEYRQHFEQLQKNPGAVLEGICWTNLKKVRDEYDGRVASWWSDLPADADAWIKAMKEQGII